MSQHMSRFLMVPPSRGGMSARKRVIAGSVSTKVEEKRVVIVGSQNVPGNGCFLITDACFEDLEIVMEMNNDFGPDSGLLLRSTKDGKAWQAIIDYNAGRNVMGIYDEGLEGKPHVRNYSFRQTV